MVNLAIKLKRNCDVSVSGITAKNDQYQRNAVGLNCKVISIIKKFIVLKPWWHCKSKTPKHFKVLFK